MEKGGGFPSKRDGEKKENSRNQQQSLNLQRRKKPYKLYPAKE